MHTISRMASLLLRECSFTDLRLKGRRNRWSCLPCGASTQNTSEKQNFPGPCSPTKNIAKVIVIGYIYTDSEKHGYFSVTEIRCGPSSCLVQCPGFAASY